MASKKAEIDEMDPRVQRLRQLYDYWDQYPGAAPGGTGETGLLSNDAQGWSRILNEQTEAANLENELSGKGPVTVKRGHDLGGMPDSIADDPDWWTQNSQMGDLASIPQSVVSMDPKGALGAIDRFQVKKNKNIASMAGMKKLL